MRKHRIPFGWSRRDPRHYRFPIPNTVWEYQLKPIAFVILSYLCCHSSHGDAKALTPEVIAKGIHKTEDTVRKYLSDLEDAGLVKEPCSLAADSLSAESGKFFTLPNEIFLLKLPPSAFMVYACLLLIEDRRTHTCHPSYNTIAAATGISRNTVIKAIGVLLEKHLVTMEHSQYLDRCGMKWNGMEITSTPSCQRRGQWKHSTSGSSAIWSWRPSAGSYAGSRNVEPVKRLPQLPTTEPSSHEPSRQAPSPTAPSKMGRPVFRILRPLVALPVAGWRHYTSQPLKRGVGPCVARL